MTKIRAAKFMAYCVKQLMIMFGFIGVVTTPMLVFSILLLG